MGQYEGMSEEDSTRDARTKDKKKKKLHYHLMKQMRELHGVGESDSELDEFEDISVPSSSSVPSRTRTKKMKLEVKKNRSKKRMFGMDFKSRKACLRIFVGWLGLIVFISFTYAPELFFSLGVSHSRARGWQAQNTCY
jgi:hypothetical protein